MRIAQLYKYMAEPHPNFAVPEGEAPLSARYSVEVLGYRLPVIWPGDVNKSVGYMLWLIGRPVMLLGPTMCILFDPKFDPMRRFSALIEPWRPAGVSFATTVRGTFATLSSMDSLPFPFPMQAAPDDWRNSVDMRGARYWFGDDDTYEAVVVTPPAAGTGSGFNRWIGSPIDETYKRYVLALCAILMEQASALTLVTSKPRLDMRAATDFISRRHTRQHARLTEVFRNWNTYCAGSSGFGIKGYDFADVSAVLAQLGLAALLDKRDVAALGEYDYAVVEAVAAGAVAEWLAEVLVTNPTLLVTDLSLASYLCVEGPAEGVRIPAVSFIKSL